MRPRAGCREDLSGVELQVMSSTVEALYLSVMERCVSEGIQPYLDILGKRHPEMLEHSHRVCRLALALGLDNALDFDALLDLGVAAFLHDYGKVKLPADIVSKPGGLDTREYRIMQGHVRLGFLEVRSLCRGVPAKIIACHHEFKTRPYPRTGMDRREGTRKDPERRADAPDILKMGSILAAADIVDALIHHRSYRDGLTLGETETILRNEFTGPSHLIDQVLEKMSRDKVHPPE